MTNKEILELFAKFDASNSKSVDIFIPIYIGDYLKDTQGLDAQEHGAYLMLLFNLWTHNGRLEFKEKKLSRMAKVDFSEWPGVWESIQMYFTCIKLVSGLNVICNSRILSQMSDQFEIRQKRINAVNKRWERERARKNENQGLSAENVGLDTSVLQKDIQDEYKADSKGDTKPIQNHIQNDTIQIQIQIYKHTLSENGVNFGWNTSKAQFDFETSFPEIDLEAFFNHWAELDYTDTAGNLIDARLKLQYCKTDRKFLKKKTRKQTGRKSGFDAEKALESFNG